MTFFYLLDKYAHLSSLPFINLTTAASCGADRQCPVMLTADWSRMGKCTDLHKCIVTERRGEKDELEPESLTSISVLLLHAIVSLRFVIADKKWILIISDGPPFR